MHGAVMMFRSIVPTVEGVMIHIMPLMVGRRVIVFPRLNSFPAACIGRQGDGPGSHPPL